MTILITGSSGTVGFQLKKLLEEKGIQVVCWDRTKVGIDNYAEMREFIKGDRPDILFHLAAVTSLNPEHRINSWKVNYEWTSELAWICRELGIKFVYTSSALVFSHLNKGPFTINFKPDAEHGYGYEKRMSEERALKQNPNAVIVRLGWQIAEKGRNSMITHLDNEMLNNKTIRASKRWLPACSFVDDTVQCLFELRNAEPGIYMIDSNNKWNFFEIVNALKEHYEKDWSIVPSEDFVYDQRMIDERVTIPSLKAKLKNLN